MLGIKLAHILIDTSGISSKRNSMDTFQKSGSNVEIFEERDSCVQRFKQLTGHST